MRQQDREGMGKIIDRSSLGAPAVKKLRSRTPDAVSTRILRNANAAARGSRSTGTTRGQ